MSAERHLEIKEAFYQAHQLTGREQERYLEILGKEDPELRREVASLLGVGDESVFSRGPLPPAIPREPFAAGHRVAERYEIESLRGSGGMGEVYRTRDLVLGTAVALKRLHSPSPESRRQLIEEALHARRVTHPAVCRVFDVGEADGELFLTMELLEGEDLGRRIERQGALSPMEVRSLAQHLIEGLGAAHEAGVIHRDLKPANVVYHHDRPRLTDFGIAVSDERQGGEGLAGTPGYLAPESLPPRVWFSVASDFYALGLVLREALTGRPVFTGRDRDELTACMRHPDLEPLGSVVPEVDDDLARLVDWCLAIDPHRRPDTAAQLLELLAGHTPPSLRPAPAPAPGRYVHLTVLGKGESTEVVRALDRLTGRVVAVKQLRATGDENPTFLRGIDPVRLAEHPHFVPVLEVGKDGNGRPFVVSALLEGARELRTVAAELPPEELRGLVTDFFAALDFLHQRGRVHGNLRSSNVLVVEGRLKLLDALDWCPRRPADTTEEPRQDLERALALVRGAFDASTGDTPSWLAELQTAADGGIGRHRRRFSFARPCIGRRQELERFEGLLDELERGQGRVILIEGESGLGKTRLVEELRLSAWRRGLLAAWGQASEVTTGAYLPWVEIWRRLALETPIDDDAFASLQVVISNLPELLERPPTSAPASDETAAQDRLFLAVSALFQSLPKATVVVLEDLQWADTGSVDLLRWLAQRAAAWRVLVVATLRPEEPAPVIDLRAVERMVLAPLAAGDVDRLVRSLLGRETVDRELAEHVEREAEGNPFFLIETVHEVVSRAAEGNTADGPGAPSAPAIRETLARRLAAVAPEHRRLFYFAALAGRIVDRSLLETLLEGDDASQRLEAWYRAGVEAWVLEPTPDGEWRFRHDKLRELLSEELEDEERRRLHGALARTVAARGGSADRVAFHGLRSETPESALEACESAGLAALKAGSHFDAVRWLKHALKLRQGMPQSSPWASGVLRHQLARAYFGIGRLDEGRPSIERALGELGTPPPRGKFATLVSILGRLPKVFSIPRRLGDQSGRDPVKAELTSAYLLYSEILWFANQPLHMTDAVTRSFVLAAGNAPSGGQAAAASALISLLAFFSSRWAHRFAAYTERLLDLLPPSLNQGVALSSTAVLYLSRGDWPNAQRFQDRALEVCRRLGHERRYHQTAAYKVALNIFRTNFPAARRLANSLVEFARRRGNPQVQAFGCTYLAELALIEGRFARARRLASDAVELARAGGDPTEADRGRALRIQALLASGERTAARGESAQLVASLGAGGFIALHSYATVAHCAEVELELLETGDPEAQRLAPQAVRALRAYARLFPIGEPRALISTARLNRCRRGPRPVLGLLRKAVARARALSMPFEEALARRTLAAFQEGRVPEPIYRWHFGEEDKAS